jgi:hypothetical protein
MERIVALMLALGVLAAGNVYAEEGVLERAEKAIKKGGEATGKAVSKGGKATVKGLKKAGGWFGEKMQKGGEKLEKVSK